MRILILTTSYPTPQKIYEQPFVRARVRGYRKRGDNVRVLSFSTQKDYELDGVEVFPEKSWRGKDLLQYFDIIVSHAPNLRQHLRFLYLHRDALPPIVFTFHGHETLIIQRHHPPPYPWWRGRWFPVKRALQNLYDNFKLHILKLVIERLRRQRRVLLIYVSHAFKTKALEDLGCPLNHWDDISMVIPNPIGVAFSHARHQPNSLLGDFLTIRPLDSSTRAIDIVVECARQNPQYSFHIYGEGQVLNYLAPPPNVVHFDGFLENDAIPALLNRYRAGLMPSRYDTQGVMMCEMAFTGMPVVASDIPAHRETLREFPRSIFLNNESPRFDAKAFLEKMDSLPYPSSKVFDHETIISAEIAAFETFISRSNAPELSGR